MFIDREMYYQIFNHPLFQLDLSNGKGLILAHDLLWTIGFTLLIITVGYTLGLYDETEDKKDFKIPTDVIGLFFIGLVMFIASYYIPIPIIK